MRVCSWFVISQQTQEDEMGEGRAGTRQKARSRVRYYAAIAAAAVTGAGVALGATAGGASTTARSGRAGCAVRCGTEEPPFVREN